MAQPPSPAAVLKVLRDLIPRYARRREESARLFESLRAEFGEAAPRPPTAPRATEEAADPASTRRVERGRRRARSGTPPESTSAPAKKPTPRCFVVCDRLGLSQSLRETVQDLVDRGVIELVDAEGGGSAEVSLPPNTTHAVWCGDESAVSVYVALACGCWVVPPAYLEALARDASAEEASYGFRHDPTAKPFAAASHLLLAGRMEGTEAKKLRAIGKALGLEVAQMRGVRDASREVEALRKEGNNVLIVRPDCASEKATLESAIQTHEFLSVVFPRPAAAKLLEWMNPSQPPLSAQPPSSSQPSHPALPGAGERTPPRSTTPTHEARDSPSIDASSISHVDLGRSASPVVPPASL